MVVITDEENERECQSMVENGVCFFFFVLIFVFFQAEDGIRDLVRSRGLGDVYKRQIEKAYLFRKLAAQKDNIGNMITTAKKLEGAVRNLSLIHI